MVVMKIYSFIYATVFDDDDDDEFLIYVFPVSSVKSQSQSHTHALKGKEGVPGEIPTDTS